MHKPLTTRNAMILKIGNLKFAMDNGKLCLLTGEGASYVLSACETLAVYNLLTDYKVETIVMAREEQRDRERRNKERQGHKKPQYVQVDGQWVEAVEVAELEQEQNE